MQDFNRPLDSAAILFANLDQFSAGDGKQLFDNWNLNFAKKIYALAQKALSDSAASSTNDSLSPPLIIYYVETAVLADLKRRSTTLKKELDKGQRRLEAVRKVRKKREAAFGSVN